MEPKVSRSSARMSLFSWAFFYSHQYFIRSNTRVALARPAGPAARRNGPEARCAVCVVIPMAQAPPTATPTAVQLLQAAGATLDGTVWTATVAQLDALHALALPHKTRLIAGRINSSDLAFTLVWASAAGLSALSDPGAGVLAAPIVPLVQ